MTAYDYLKKGTAELLAAGVPDADHDAKELLLYAFQWSSRDWLDYAGAEIGSEFVPVSESEIPNSASKSELMNLPSKVDLYLTLIKKRAARIPLQHLLQEAWFYGYRFYVNEDVLIPRFDTEILVEATIQEMDRVTKSEQTAIRETDRVSKNADTLSVLDLCTGSGCIAVSLKKERPEWDVSGSDISEKALKVARRNGEENGAEVRWIQSDLLENAGKYRIIVSNPPYIDAEEMKALEPEVKDHDPALALYGGPDGLFFYRKIVESAREHLEKGGALLFEIGDTQGPAVKKLMEDAGFTEVQVLKDLTGHDRVVTGKIILA